MRAEAAGPASATSVECLECVVDEQTIGVPLGAIDRLLEYEPMAPPPLVHAWVAGLGLDGDVPFLSLSPLPRRHTGLRKGLLFRTDATPMRFALEVDAIGAVRTFGAAASEVLLPAGWTCPASWIGATATGAWRLDVDTLRRHVGGS